MRLMLGSPVFEAEHATTRDQTLHGIERLARRSGRSELAVARTLLDLMHARRPGTTRAAAVTSHWLPAPAGRRCCARSACTSARRCSARGALRHLALPVYLGSLLLGTFGLVAWLLRAHMRGCRTRQLAVGGWACWRRC